MNTFMKKTLSVVLGLSVLSCSIGGTTVSANNNDDTDFSVYAQAGQGDFLAFKTPQFPVSVKDSYLPECSYYAANEKNCYVAFRKKTDTTSVYLKVTSNSSSSKKIDIRVVSPTYDSSYNAKVLTGAWLNNTKCSYQVGKYTVVYNNWYDAYVNCTYNRNGVVSVYNWPGEYLIWNEVKEDGRDYCGLLVKTSDYRYNSRFEGCWSPDSTGSYTVLK